MLDETQTLSETKTLGEAMRPPYIATIILLVGSLLAGVGFSAVQPPFEAVDETAHYSYIQQMAETGTWPRVNDPSSADVDEYLRLAPGPNLVDGRWSYSAFLKASADTVHAGTSAIHAERERDRSWRPGARKNYEGQHPPLYYALLAPLWSASKGWSIYAQFVLLRSASYLFAWGGLVIATFSIARSSAGSPYAPLLVVGPALWPALFPQWFPEMARLGNDSLVLLLLALASVVIRRGFSPNGKTVHFALLGGVCGLGLLTKATVLPFVAALGLFLTWSAWRARGDAAMLRAWISRLVVFCLVTVAIAGWWYVKNQIVYGNIVGSSDAIALAKQGGLIKGLSEILAATDHFWSDPRRRVVFVDWHELVHSAAARDGTPTQHSAYCYWCRLDFPRGEGEDNSERRHHCRNDAHPVCRIFNDTSACLYSVAWCVCAGRLVHPLPRPAIGTVGLARACGCLAARANTCQCPRHLSGAVAAIRDRTRTFLCRRMLRRTDCN